MTRLAKVFGEVAMTHADKMAGTLKAVAQDVPVSAGRMMRHICLAARGEDMNPTISGEIGLGQRLSRLPTVRLIKTMVEKMDESLGRYRKADMPNP